MPACTERNAFSPIPPIPPILLLTPSDDKKQWINELRSAFHRGGDAPPIMVAGLKRDLRGPPPQNGGDANDGPEAAAFPEEGYRAAQEMRVDGYVECSAATGELLRLAFEEICRAAVETASVDGGGGSSGGDADGGCVIL